MTIFYNIMETDANKDEDRNSVCVMEFVNNREKAEGYVARCNRSQNSENPKYRYRITITKVVSGD